MNLARFDQMSKVCVDEPVLAKGTEEMGTEDSPVSMETALSLKSGSSSNNAITRPAVSTRRAGGVRKPRRIMFRRYQSEDEDDDIIPSFNNSSTTSQNRISSFSSQPDHQNDDNEIALVHARNDVGRQHSSPCSGFQVDNSVKSISSCSGGLRSAANLVPLPASSSPLSISDDFNTTEPVLDHHHETTTSNSESSSPTTRTSATKHKRVQFIAGSSPEDLLFPFWLPEYDDDIDFNSNLPPPPPPPPSASFLSKRSLSTAAPSTTSTVDTPLTHAEFLHTQQKPLLPDTATVPLPTNALDNAATQRILSTIDTKDKSHADTAVANEIITSAVDNETPSILSSITNEPPSVISSAIQNSVPIVPNFTSNAVMAPMHAQLETMNVEPVLLDDAAKVLHAASAAPTLVGAALQQIIRPEVAAVAAAQTLQQQTKLPGLLPHPLASESAPVIHDTEADKNDDDLIVAEEQEKTIDQSPDGRFVKLNFEIGRGSFKTVYNGMDTESGASVAWCETPARNLSKSERKRFREEASMLKEINHPNIVRFCDFWETTTSDRGKCFILITELMTSGTLRTFMRRFPKLPQKVMKSWCRQILNGLNYLHSLEPPVIHRDVKCDNILIGSSGEVKIGDLGLATFKSENAAKSVIGTPEFMAPEMFEEHYDEKVDIYAFGMCMLEMATNEYPYSECQSAAQIYRKVIAGLPPACLEKVEDRELRNIIERCIMKDTGERLSIKDLMRMAFFVEEGSAKVELARKAEDALSAYNNIKLRLKIPDAKKNAPTVAAAAAAAAAAVAAAANSTSAAVTAGGAPAAQAKPSNASPAVEPLEFEYNITSESSEDVARELHFSGRIAEGDIPVVAKQIRDRCAEMLKEREFTVKRLEKEKELHDRQQKYKDEDGDGPVTPTNRTTTLASLMPAIVAVGDIAAAVTASAAPASVEPATLTEAAAQAALTITHSVSAGTLTAGPLSPAAVPVELPLQACSMLPAVVQTQAFVAGALPAETANKIAAPSMQNVNNATLLLPGAVAASPQQMQLSSAASSAVSSRNPTNDNSVQTSGSVTPILAANAGKSAAVAGGVIDNFDELRMKLRALSNGGSVSAAPALAVAATAQNVQPADNNSVAVPAKSQQQQSAAEPVSGVGTTQPSPTETAAAIPVAPSPAFAKPDTVTAEASSLTRTAAGPAIVTSSVSVPDMATVSATPQVLNPVATTTNVEKVVANASRSAEGELSGAAAQVILPATDNFFIRATNTPESQEPFLSLTEATPTNKFPPHSFATGTTAPVSLPPVVHYSADELLSINSSNDLPLGASADNMRMPSAQEQSLLSPFVRPSALFSAVNNADYYYITDSTTSLQPGRISLPPDSAKNNALPTVNTRCSLPALGSAGPSPANSSSKPTMTPSSSSTSLVALAQSDIEAIRLTDKMLRMRATVESPEPATAAVLMSDADNNNNDVTIMASSMPNLPAPHVLPAAVATGEQNEVGVTPRATVNDIMPRAASVERPTGPLTAVQLDMLSRVSLPTSPLAELHPSLLQQQTQVLPRNISCAELTGGASQQQLVQQALALNTMVESVTGHAAAVVPYSPVATAAPAAVTVEQTTLAPNYPHLLKCSASVGVLDSSAGPLSTTNAVAGSKSNIVESATSSTSVSNQTAPPAAVAASHTATSSKTAGVTAAVAPTTAIPGVSPAFDLTAVGKAPVTPAVDNSGNGGTFVAENRRGRFSVAVRKDDLTLPTNTSMARAGAKMSVGGGGVGANRTAQLPPQQQIPQKNMRSSVPRMSSGVTPAAHFYQQPSQVMPVAGNGKVMQQPQVQVLAQKNGRVLTGNGQQQTAEQAAARQAGFGQRSNSNSTILQQQQHRGSIGFPAVNYNNVNPLQQHGVYTPFLSPAPVSMRQFNNQQQQQPQQLLPQHLLYSTPYSFDSTHSLPPQHHQQPFVHPQHQLNNYLLGTPTPNANAAAVTVHQQHQPQPNKSDRAQAIEIIRMLAADVVDACASRTQPPLSAILPSLSTTVGGSSNNNSAAINAKMSNSLPSPSMLDGINDGEPGAAADNSPNGNVQIDSADANNNDSGGGMFRAPTAPGSLSVRRGRVSPAVPRKYSTPPPSQAGTGNGRNNQNMLSSVDSGSTKNFNDLDLLLAASASQSVSVNNVNTCRRYMEALVNQQAQERDLLNQRQQRQVLEIADALKEKFSSDPTTLDFVTAIASKLLLVTLLNRNPSASSTSAGGAAAAAAGPAAPPKSASSSAASSSAGHKHQAQQIQQPQHQHQNRHPQAPPPAVAQQQQQQQLMRRVNGSSGFVASNHPQQQQHLSNGHHQHHQQQHTMVNGVGAYYNNNSGVLPAAAAATPRSGVGGGMPSSASSVSLFSDGYATASPYYNNLAYNGNHQYQQQLNDPAYSDPTAAATMRSYYNTISSPYQPISYDGGSSNIQYYDTLQHLQQQQQQHQSQPQVPQYHRQHLPMHLPNQLFNFSNASNNGDINNGYYAATGNGASSSVNNSNIKNNNTQRQQRLLNHHQQQQQTLHQQQHQQDDELLLLCGSNNSSIGEVESLASVPNDSNAAARHQQQPPSFLSQSMPESDDGQLHRLHSTFGGDGNGNHLANGIILDDPNAEMLVEQQEQEQQQQQQHEAAAFAHAMQSTPRDSIGGSVDELSPDIVAGNVNSYEQQQQQRRQVTASMPNIAAPNDDDSVADRGLQMTERNDVISENNNNNQSG